MPWLNDLFTACWVWLVAIAIFYLLAKVIFPEAPGRNSLLGFFGRFVRMLLLTVIAVTGLASLRILNALTLASFYVVLIWFTHGHRHNTALLRGKFVARVIRVEDWCKRKGWKEPIILLHKQWFLSARGIGMLPVIGATIVTLLLVAEIRLWWPLHQLRFAYPEAYLHLLRTRQLLHDTGAFAHPIVIPSMLAVVASLGATDAMQVTRFLPPFLDIFLALVGGVATATLFRSNWIGIFAVFLLGCYAHQSIVTEGLIGILFLLLSIAFLADYYYRGRRPSLYDFLCAFILLAISFPRIFPRGIALILLFTCVLGLTLHLWRRWWPHYYIEGLLPGVMMVAVFLMFRPTFPSPHFMEYEITARQSLRIVETYPGQLWTIAAPIEQFSETYGMGQYEDLDEFVRKYHDRAGDPSFHFPYKTLFVFVEKRPFQYFPTEPITIPLSILTDPTYRNYRSPAGRSSLELATLKLCKDYGDTHPRRVFYEDENLRIYDFSR